MDRGPLNYDSWGIIKRRICVENVPGVELLGMDCSQNYAFFHIYLHYISFAFHLHFA